MKERDFLAGLIRKIPGVHERTVVQADFVDGETVVASVRAGTKEGLQDELGTARAYLAGETIQDGKIIFSAEKRLKIPLIEEDIVVEKQGLIGIGPEAFRRALEMLPGE